MQRDATGGHIFRVCLWPRSASLALLFIVSVSIHKVEISGKQLYSKRADGDVDPRHHDEERACWCTYGGLRNSKHESTLSSQEYVHELRSGITEDKLLNCLESLRVSLTSNPVRRCYRVSVPSASIDCKSFYLLESELTCSAPSVFRVRSRTRRSACQSYPS
ncbi:unnamed protein product [Boreogadus saida]